MYIYIESKQLSFGRAAVIIMDSIDFPVNETGLIKSEGELDGADCNMSLVHFSGIKYLLEKCSSFSGPLQKALIQVFQEEYGDSRDEPDLPLPVLICILTVFIIMIMFGTLGSTLVILVVARKPAMRSRSNMFIMNLAISDLTLCLFTEPFNLFQIWATNRPWTLGSLMCKILAMFQGTNIFVSTISITAIALDRFQCIIYPTVPNRRAKNVAKLLILVWLAAFALASPLAFFSHVDEVKVQRCTERTFNRLTQKMKISYYVAALFFQYVVPLLIVSIVYWRICMRIRNRFSRTINKGRVLEPQGDKQLTGQCSHLPGENPTLSCPGPQHVRGSAHKVNDVSEALPNCIDRLQVGEFQAVQRSSFRSSRSQRENKPILLLSAIAIVFGLSWLPLNISNVYMEFKEMMIAQHFQLPGLMGWYNTTSNASSQSILLKEQSLIGPENVHIFQTFCLFLVLSSACFNPVLYGWLNVNFRAEFRSIFCTKVCRREGQLYTSKQERTSNQFHVQPITTPEFNSCPVQWIISPPLYSSGEIGSSRRSDKMGNTNNFKSVKLSEAALRDSVVNSKSNTVDTDLKHTEKHCTWEESGPTNSSSSCVVEIPDRPIFIDTRSDQVEIERMNQSLLRALSENNEGQDTIPEVDLKSEQQEWCSLITAV
ncbi:Neuropeptide F receptor [Fasciola hepatica]|uniref:Neuropeptide F receptor n=1 Tax=Fasciola hepatica TaxID=6192 RepID=A0A4E0RDD6_FASHE|nr:Neuropeptide F receptor [Fasciola hepatica]